MTDDIAPIDPAPAHLTDEELNGIYKLVQNEEWAATEDQIRRDRGYPMPARPEPWTPATRRQAEWAMAIVAADDAEIAGLRAERDAHHARIDEAHQDAVRPRERRRDRLAAALERFALAWHDEDPRVNVTLSLPSGKVGTTTPRTPAVRIADPAAVMCWLESLDPDAVKAASAIKRPDPEVMISGVKRLVTTTEKDGGWVVVDPTSGEVVDGLVAELGHTTAKVKPAPPVA